MIVSWEGRADTARGDVSGALNSILSEPPYGDGVDEAKVSTANLLLSGAMITSHGL
jgi:actin related protein 2/3 complex subunit 5